MINTTRFLIAVGTSFALGGAGGWWWANHAAPAHAPAHPPQSATTPPPAPQEKRVLYWYDPMSPDTHFDKPGKSPFMDMDLVPKYAEDSPTSAGVRIDGAMRQNLGMRLARVTREALAAQVEASGEVAFDEHAVAIVQARTGGFVERAWPLAVGDVVTAGQPLVELRVPEWTAAQQEFLALRRTTDAALAAAARDRLLALGMPAALIEAIARSGMPQPRVTIAAPRAGAITEIGVREGMTVAPGMTLARINGIDAVWIDAALPEALAARIAVGDTASARVAGLPAQEGSVAALLPALDAATRTVRARIVLPNPDALLKPGMSAAVTLHGAPRGDALTVPTEAIVRTGRRALVMLAGGEGRYTPTVVTLGEETGGRTVVTSGVEEGQDVVASGQFLIDSEARIGGIEPADTGDAP